MLVLTYLFRISVPDALEEQDRTRQLWYERDRSAVLKYDPHLRYQAHVAARYRAMGRLACSAAIAAMRVAASNPPAYELWLDKHRVANELRPTAGRWHVWGTSAACSDGWGASVVLGDKNSRRDATPMDIVGYNVALQALGWGPCWDGVTFVPKTPQKKKLRRLRKKLKRAEDAEYHRMWDELDRQSQEWEAEDAAEDTEWMVRNAWDLKVRWDSDSD